LVDIGDQVAVTGEVISSKRGELSVMATRWELAAKALRPLQVEHKPLSEETRVRQRYVDMIVRPEARANARNRAAVVHTLRDIMHRRDVVEVETPVLQAIPSGASARPFATTYNAMNMEVYLRIALELYLKRRLV